MEKKYPKKCCICGIEINGHGNDPWPYASTETERCCDHCNLSIVIPLRLRVMKAREKQTRKQGA